MIPLAPRQLARIVRLALTPRGARVVTRLADGIVVVGRNRAVYGGRGIYVYREVIEPEFLNLPRFLPRSRGMPERRYRAYKNAWA